MHCNIAIRPIVIRCDQKWLSCNHGGNGSLRDQCGGYARCSGDTTIGRMIDCRCIWVKVVAANCRHPSSDSHWYTRHGYGADW